LHKVYINPNKKRSDGGHKEFSNGRFLEAVVPFAAQAFAPPSPWRWSIPATKFLFIFRALPIAAVAEPQCLAVANAIGDRVRFSLFDRFLCLEPEEELPKFNTLPWPKVTFQPPLFAVGN
jgi:hypothetical protein